MESIPTAEHPALATVAGDQCAGCGAPLAPDQRYCIQCGQRRGQSRLPLAQPVAVREHTTVARAARGPRVGVNAALIAGVGTLLLAMGVGVLIGRSGHSDAASRAASPVQVVTVGSGGAAGTAATAAASGNTAKAAKSTGKKATAADAAKAAKQIKGTNLKLPKKAVVTVGSKGTGPGYQHGKFTGNFFGG